MTDWMGAIYEFDLAPPVAVDEHVEIPELEPLPRVILFDVYGTLLCPRIGDLAEQTSQTTGSDSFVATARRFGFDPEVGRQWHQWFFDSIAAEHARMKKLGVVPAEVQVKRIWKEMITRIGASPVEIDVRALAAYREMQANPVRAFSGTVEALRRLQGAGVKLGLVSNAQFYTLPILGYVLRLKPEEVFSKELTFLSYQLGFAKPSPYFFRLVQTRLLHLGFEPFEALVVGNDYDNDVAAAETHGLRALLFHGSDASVRLGSSEGPVPTIRNFASLAAAYTREV